MRQKKTARHLDLSGKSKCLAVFKGIIAFGSVRFWCCNWFRHRLSDGYSAVPLTLNNSWLLVSQYKKLLLEREELERLIEEARRSEMAAAVTRVRQLVAEYGLKPEDVFPVARGATRGPRKDSGSGIKVAAKYRDPATGLTWTGRGKPPRWIKDKDRSQFAIT